jgi:hypothetical protein
MCKPLSGKASPSEGAAPESRVVYVDNDHCKSGCEHALGRSGWLKRTREQKRSACPCGL